MRSTARVAAVLALGLLVATIAAGCWTPDPTPVVLHFEGEAGMLTDPFTLPAGVYRATLTTTGYCIVHVVPVAAPADITYLFACSAGEATAGESVLYVSDSSRIMLEFSNVSAPYALALEAID
jgi:hypothetical protein